MKETLQQKITRLEQLGYRVQIEHDRETETGFGITVIKPRGGVTRASIYIDETLVGYDTAHCSKGDNYNRKIGALIALGRAEKQLAPFASFVCEDFFDIEGHGRVFTGYSPAQFPASNINGKPVKFVDKNGDASVITHVTGIQSFYDYVNIGDPIGLMVKK